MELIPEELRRAHEDGDVVLICGAGVSVPAGRPSFKGLIKAVLNDLLPVREMCEPGTTEALAWKAFDDEKYDEALDILESPHEGGYEPKNVRERVHHHLTKSRTKTLKKHVILSRLADLDTENGRLVTTNFDPLFERAQKKLRLLNRSRHRMAVHVAPTLPPAKPETFYGLTYLHGKLGHSRDDKGLILTTADFGTAYMLEGWARRFVVELFRHYQVVFIGYRVQDPTMRYLVSALAAARQATKHFKEAYAFAPYGEDEDEPDTKEEAEQEWNLKRLNPLAYDTAGEHRQLWKELSDWADDHRHGIAGRRQAVARFGKLPPLNENDPTIREMAWALKDKAVARHFANLTDDDRPDPNWIAPLQKEGLLNRPIGETEQGQPIRVSLVSRELSEKSELHDATLHLGRWIAGCLDCPESLEWALVEGSVLHPAMRWQIEQSLKSTEDSIPEGLRKIWRVLADSNYAHAMSARRERTLLHQPCLAPENTFAIRTFLDRLRPIPVFKVKDSVFSRQRDAEPEHPRHWCDIHIELVGIRGDYDIRRFRETASDWNGALAVMADDITTRLNEALNWLQELDLASPEEDPTQYEYRSISPHEQNKYAHTWTQLIALCRDSYDALVDSGDVAAAGRLARRWQSLPFPVFRRLAFYAATGGRNA